MLRWFICHKKEGHYKMTNKNIKNNHLDEVKREIIQRMLGNTNFTLIGRAINKDRTTIAKEVKRNRYIKSNFYEPFDQEGINKAIESCKRLQKAPYVCNFCPDKIRCLKHKLYYNSKIAQKKYDKVLVSSREGINIPLETIEEIEKSIVSLIKDKKQSVNQVYANHSDILFFSKTTFYKYVNEGIFSLCNLDLPKQVKYKKRKSKEKNRQKRELKLLKGRSYDEYLKFVSNHPNMNVVETDTVEGTAKSKKVLHTLIIKETKLMLIFLLNKQNVENVNCTFETLKKKLGIKLYAKVFRIVLTDNGPEFFNPLAIERDYDSGKKVANLFYCDPYSSWQKGTLEKNHVYIRMLYPKGNKFFEGACFDNLSEQDIKDMENHINNVPRKELDNKTPYELTKEKYPDLIEKLNCSYIKPDDVDLSERQKRNKKY